MIFIVVSTGHFDPLIAECEKLRHRFDFKAQIGSGVVLPSFPHYRTAPPQQIEADMAESELVISHGGTGMLSMIYGLKKRTVIAPKQICYGESNNGQVELATQWAELGMGILCLDVTRLDLAIEECRRTEPFFPIFPSRCCCTMPGVTFW